MEYCMSIIGFGCNVLKCYEGIRFGVAWCGS